MEHFFLIRQLADVWLVEKENKGMHVPSERLVIRHLASRLILWENLICETSFGDEKQEQ